jgi:phenylalanyl-tRNA synthetase beta subunit
LTFRAPDRTLAEAEVDAATEAITHAITSAVGGRVRT